MERGCFVCGGRCGAVWTRAPIDSNDFGEGHWAGTCLLSKDEQARIMGELAKNLKKD
jgi:hypothetical protein